MKVFFHSLGGVVQISSYIATDPEAVTTRPATSHDALARSRAWARYLDTLRDKDITLPDPEPAGERAAVKAKSK